ncbi:MAG: FAD-binding oxidoreductase [Thermoleophilia bacterium]|nr:FAD-binding oxidoreductase [Thermoleophilia bacterium]
MGSYWLEEATDPLPRRRLRGRAEVEVVGAGVTGCACALALAAAGVEVRVHEARTVASGASGRNGGFALRGGAMPYDEARVLLGGAARLLWEASERAVERLAGLAGDAFRRTGSLRLAWDAGERARLEREHEALLADGFAAEWLDEVGVPSGGRFPGALVHPRDGALAPARWVRRLASLAVEAGAELREASRVESLAALEADAVVIATDGYTRGLLAALDLAIRPARGQVLVTEPLSALHFDRPHYARDGYDYWQQTPDRRLVVGGRRDTSLATEWTAEEATTAAVQGELEALVRELLGRVPPVTHRWAGIFGSTADRLPLVGAVPGRPGTWVAAGYSGHGNVLGLACGELVAAAILGRRDDELLALFDPARVVDAVAR